MSHNRAGTGMNIPQRFSKLKLMSGCDCDTRVSQYPDLYVRGGALIKKTLCVGGNLELTGNGAFIGNLMGNLVGDSTVFGNLLIEGEIVGNGNIFIDQNADILCNLFVGKESVLEGNVQAGNNVNVEGNVVVDQNVMVGCNIEVTKTVTAETVRADTVIASNIECAEQITGKGDLVICNEGDLVLKPSGNLVLDPSSIDFDLTKSQLSNVNSVASSRNPPCPLDLDPANGFKVRIVNGDGIDLQDRNLCNANVVETNTVTSTGDLVLDPTGKTVVNGNLCVNEELQIGKIRELNPTQGLNLCGDVTMENNATISGDLDVCGNINGKMNIELNDIEADTILANTLTVNNDARIVGDLEVCGNINGKMNIELDDIEANSIVANSVTTNELTIASELDMGCANISNVGTLFVGNIFGKSPVDVFDNFNMKDTVSGGKLTFESGIEIGDASTEGGISIGKGASSLDSGMFGPSVAIGTSAFANITSVAVGTGAKAEDQSVALGWAALKSSLPGAARNVSIGLSSLCTLTTGTENTAIGTVSGTGVTTGSFNTFVGSESMVQSSLYGAITAATVLGSRSNVAADYTVSVGHQTYNSGSEGIAIGHRANATANFDTAIGCDAQASGISSLAMMRDSRASGFQSICIGQNSKGNAIATISIGGSAFAYANTAIAIGSPARASGVDSIALGSGAIAFSRGGISIGSAEVRHDYGIGIGFMTDVYEPKSIAIGYRSVVRPNADSSIAIGEFSRVDDNSYSGIAIGKNATVTSNAYVQIGEHAKYSGGNACMYFRSQIVGNEEWCDGTVQLASIDEGGNIVKGGVVTISGDITVDDANVCGVLRTDVIDVKTTAEVEPIRVLNDFDFEGNDITGVDELDANVVCAPVLQVNNIVPKVGTDVNVTGNLMVSNTTEVNQFDANIVCSPIVQVSNIEPKVGANVNLLGSLIVSDTIFVSNIAGNSPVTINDDLILQGTLSVGNISGAGPLVVSDSLLVDGNIFIEGTQVVGPQQPDIGSLTLDAGLSGLTPDGSLVEVGNTANMDESGNVNGNFADLAEKINMIFDVLRLHGLMA